MMLLTSAASLSEQVSYDRAESGCKNNWIQLGSLRTVSVTPLPTIDHAMQNTHQFLFAQPLRPLSSVIEEVSAKARVTFREAVEEVAIVIAKVQQPSLFVLIDWLVVVVFTQVAFLESSTFNLSHIHIFMLEFVGLFKC